MIFRLWEFLTESRRAVGLENTHLGTCFGIPARYALSVGGPDLTDNELIDLGRSAGLDESAFAQCVLIRAYLAWTAYVTFMAGQRGVGATPTVMVDGVFVPPNPPGDHGGRSGRPQLMARRVAGLRSG
jgi:hypothetical protein